jgi:hypothetical protein
MGTMAYTLVYTSSIVMAGSDQYMHCDVELTFEDVAGSCCLESHEKWNEYVCRESTLTGRLSIDT